MWLTARERLTLAGLGTVALLGLGVLLWQRQTPPLTIGDAPAAHDAVQWDLALDDSRRVDINAAGVAELERLPEVGPSLAQRIVDHRRAHGRFRAVEELDEVPGIGPKTLEALKEHVTTQ